MGDELVGDFFTLNHVQNVVQHFFAFGVGPGLSPSPAVVKVVFAFLLVSQDAFRVIFESLRGAVVGLRCISLIGLQLRVEPDQRVGLALRAAAQTTSRFLRIALASPA